MDAPTRPFTEGDRWFGSPTVTALAEAGKAAVALIATLGFAGLTILVGYGALLSFVAWPSVLFAALGVVSTWLACKQSRQALRRTSDHWRVVRATEAGLETHDLCFSQVVPWSTLRRLDRTGDGGLFVRCGEPGTEYSIWIPAEVEGREELEGIIEAAVPHVVGRADVASLTLENRAPVEIWRTVLIGGLIALLLCWGESARVIGLHVLRVDPTPVLLTPIPVVRATDEYLVLGNGLTLAITDRPYIPGHFEYPPDHVDLAYRADGTLEVYAQVTRSICGTPWARPIIIPWHVDWTPLFERKLIATARPVAPPAR